MSLQQVTIQVLQRNGRKFFTSIIGLPDDLDKEKIVHHLKKTYKCNGFITKNAEFGEIITLTGDHKESVYRFFIDEEICVKEEIIIKGL